MHFAAAAAGAVLRLLPCPSLVVAAWPHQPPPQLAPGLPVRGDLVFLAVSGSHCCGPPMSSRCEGRTAKRPMPWFWCSARIVCGASPGVHGALFAGPAPARRTWRASLLLPATLVVLSWCPVPHRRPSRRRRHGLRPRRPCHARRVQPSAGGRLRRCHTDATQQWRSSLHAQAVTDEYYLAVATLFIEERGSKRSATARPATTRWA